MNRRFFLKIAIGASGAAALGLPASAAVITATLAQYEVIPWRYSLHYRYLHRGVVQYGDRQAYFSFGADSEKLDSECQELINTNIIRHFKETHDIEITNINWKKEGE